MTLAEALTAGPSAPPRTTPVRPSHPQGWEPGVTWSPKTGGTLTTGPLEAQPDDALWAELVKDWGLDPTTMEVADGSWELIGWDGQIAKSGGQLVRMKRYKCRLRPRSTNGTTADVEELCQSIMKRRPRKRAAEVFEGNRALVVNVADLQIGKGEGDGTIGTVQRALDCFDRVVDRIAELKRAGRPVQMVYLVGCGDIVEGCAGNYGNQTWSVDMDDRSQDRIARRIIHYGVDAISAVVDRVILAAVPGNHGENRGQAGKVYTNITDNRDLSVFESVGEILAANPARYGHVSVVLADNYNLVLDVCGVPVGWSHGQGRGKGGAGMHKIEAWLKGQALGRTPIADVQVLVTAHYHHLLVSESTGRTIMQCPALDPGSSWWTECSGQSSPSGMLTFVAGSGCGPRGWDDLAVL